MYRLAIVTVSLVLGACASTPKPASVPGECAIFSDPGFPVRGARDKDQRWITRTQETGITVCGWARPAPEPEVPTVAPPAPPAPVAVPTPAPDPAPARRSFRERWFGV